MRDFISTCLTLDPQKRPLPLDMLHHSLVQSLPVTSSTIPIAPQFPVIDPSLCLVDFSEYKKKLNITEDAFKDILPQYPHYPNKSHEEENSKPWRYVIVI